MNCNGKSWMLSFPAELWWNGKRRELICTAPNKSDLLSSFDRYLVILTKNENINSKYRILLVWNSWDLFFIFKTGIHFRQDRLASICNSWLKLIPAWNVKINEFLCMNFQFFLSTQHIKCWPLVLAHKIFPVNASAVLVGLLTQCFINVWTMKSFWPLLGGNGTITRNASWLSKSNHFFTNAMHNWNLLEFLQ